MYTKYFGSFISYGFGLTILTIIMFAAFRYFHVPSGQLLDWIIGLATAWWLIMIVTVPWNVYFEAIEVVDQSAQSARIGISINQEDLAYVKKVSQRALLLAVNLHIASAIGLFLLSAFGISPIGYVGSACALLFTALRPSVRAYEYLWQRLLEIRHRIKYPREDVAELRTRMKDLERDVRELEDQLNPNNTNSFAGNQVATNHELRQAVTRVSSAHESLEDTNRREHLKLARDAEQSIAKISADTQFLDHVREIVRLIKSA